ncbi:unnamed protein product [Closterium sp. NIES-53]
MSRASGSHNGQVRRRRESEGRGDRRRRLKLQAHGQQEAYWHSGYRTAPGLQDPTPLTHTRCYTTSSTPTHPPLNPKPQSPTHPPPSATAAAVGDDGGGGGGNATHPPPPQPPPPKP